MMMTMMPQSLAVAQAQNEGYRRVVAGADSSIFPYEHVIIK